MLGWAKMLVHLFCCWFFCCLWRWAGEWWSSLESRRFYMVMIRNVALVSWTRAWIAMSDTCDTCENSILIIFRWDAVGKLPCERVAYGPNSLQKIQKQWRATFGVTDLLNICVDRCWHLEIMSQITSRVSPRKNSTGIMELEPMSLTQARWSEHRKKIGLSYSSFNSFHHEITPQDVSSCFRKIPF